MDLNTVCFIMFSFLLLGYLLLEGFDYGVGMLHPFLGKSESEKRAILQTIAPVWEGNEVWLIAAGAVLFAGFPDVYATLFSGLYLALLLILVTLILRGVAFEFRNQDNNPAWRKFWDWSIFLGSIIPALLWGIALANLLYGLPIDGEKQYVGTFGDLLSIYSLTGGLFFTLLFLLHGTVFLTLRLDHRFTPQVRKIGLTTSKYAILLSAGFILLSFLRTDLTAKLVPAVALAALFLALLFCCRYLKDHQYVLSFIFSTTAIISTVAAIFTGLFPRLIVSSLNPDWSLTVYNSASNPLTLKIMAVTMAIVLPAVLAFEIWKYHIFRERVNINNATIESHKLLWEQLHWQLQQLITHSRNLITIIKKGKKTLGSSVNSLDKVPETATANELQKFRELIRYGRQVAQLVAKMINRLRN
ncbi:cytochrome d ubiquinol oxidase subunit II [Sporomusa sphaeroides]|uniref:Cytochrome bd-I ubiquinol oxidase subunit 2 n=1 Tax=Sporomusa sphaeroides DSM 2875 TaxID=1337886 RepID=A0ABP2C2S5_9FIRM|nr:cytochrome d ubiquinol oxidase subunit II [Sporomusa sphaeroides]OLS55823.1 cytochrome bd-I ubiquinol oxidase subunit 2 [Sporomusa sphaeroides DSM 2875]CVK18824.1 Cytochrome bd-I ubiquinol oxidase subunit 2 [Sporomusa sphaeroides DSM 2875]